MHDGLGKDLAAGKWSSSLEAATWQNFRRFLRRHTIVCVFRSILTVLLMITAPLTQANGRLQTFVENLDTLSLSGSVRRKEDGTVAQARCSLTCQTCGAMVFGPAVFCIHQF
jgi:hypothetical protein